MGGGGGGGGPGGICNYFNSPSGCKKGDQCTFTHQKNDFQPNTYSGASSVRGGGRGRGRGRGDYSGFDNTNGYQP